MTVALTSSKATRAQPTPNSLTIPAGLSSGVVVNTFDVTVTSTVTIKATAGSKTRSATLTINQVF